MARNPIWDTEKLCSHAPRVGAGEPGAAATTRRVEGAPATASADGDGPDLLGSTVEVVDELAGFGARGTARDRGDRKSTRLNSSHGYISYAVFCLKKKKRSGAFCGWRGPSVVPLQPRRCVMAC